MSKLVTKKNRAKLSPSKPIESLINTSLWQGVVEKIGKKNLQILDYHCGKGNDIEWLKQQGYANAEGFDPKYYPQGQRKKHQIKRMVIAKFFIKVFLSYTLLLI